VRLAREDTQKLPSIPSLVLAWAQRLQLLNEVLLPAERSGDARPLFAGGVSRAS